MKKNVYVYSIVLVLLMSCILSGCQSTKHDLRQNSPVVLISVYANSHYPWYEKDSQNSQVTEDYDDDSGDGLLNNAVTGLLSKNDPEVLTIQERADYAASALRRAFEENGMVVVDQEKVNSSKAMKKSSFMSFMETKTPATGFTTFGSTETKRTKDILRENEAKAGVYAYFKFQKEKIGSTAFGQEARARCVMQIYVYDDLGHRLAQKEYTGYSYDTVPYRNGSWDKALLCAYAEEAADSAISQFMFDYAGSFALEEASMAGETNAEDAGDNTVAPTQLKTPLAVPSMPAE